MQQTPARLRRTFWDLSFGTAIGVLAGGASAGFLWALERVIAFRVGHGWILFLLPIFGALSALMYRHFGNECEGGGSLILDEVIEFRGRVHSRMAPLVFLGTLLTHLGGGSAGREGTAVQMGAALARTLGKLPFPILRLTRSRQRLLLMAGVSAGFGSLFGTPLAGAIFGLEVISIGKLHYEGIVICAAASFVGDWVCQGLGAQHVRYALIAPPFTWELGWRLAVFAVPVALVAGAFSELAHGLAAWSKARFHYLVRPAVGGIAVVLLALLLKHDGYLNLGLPWLEQVFTSQAPVPPWAFAGKLLITVVTVGFGFKGGEVTPLFVIGALLGATLAGPLHLPVLYLAPVGFIAVFAAASNTPIASTLMGIELFGATFAGPLTLACFLAYVLVGHRGIYGGQRIHTRKPGH